MLPIIDSLFLGMSDRDESLKGPSLPIARWGKSPKVVKLTDRLRATFDRDRGLIRVAGGNFLTIPGVRDVFTSGEDTRSVLARLNVEFKNESVVLCPCGDISVEIVSHGNRVTSFGMFYAQDVIE
jgi:hypothetical protein